VKDKKDILEFSLNREKDAISRRRFLTLLSASATLALGASCSKVDRGTIVPYTRKPGDIIPGIAEYYASTFQEGLVTHGVLVKTREGRPIHIERNPEHPVSQGKPGLRAMGDLLGLYDPDRLRAPSHKGASAAWEEAQKEMIRALSNARSANKPVLLLTGAVMSPTQRALINDLKLAVPGLYHAAWEPCASRSEAVASEGLFGKAIIPRLRIDSADVIVSLQSDFLGADANAPAFVSDFSAHRTPNQPTEKMNRLWVIEGSMTLTGANADQRLPVRPSRIAALAFALARSLYESHFLPLPPGLRPEELEPFALDVVAKGLGIEPSMLRQLVADLAQAQESALVVAGPTLPPEAHVACFLLNAMLGAERATMDWRKENSPPEFSGIRIRPMRFQIIPCGRMRLPISPKHSESACMRTKPLWTAHGDSRRTIGWKPGEILNHRPILSVSGSPLSGLFITRDRPKSFCFHACGNWEMGHPSAIWSISNPVGGKMSIPRKVLCPSKPFGMQQCMTGV